MATSINKARLLLAAALSTPASAQNLGERSANILFPFVPGAAAIRPDDGRLLAWSPRQRNMHGIGQYRETFLATYDLITGSITEKTISNTEHDMSCPDISAAHDGRLVVTGRPSTNKVSIHHDSFGDNVVASPT